MNDLFESAWQGIEESLAGGRLAHAWLLTGPVQGDPVRFANKLLNRLFDGHPQIHARTHPDVMWLEPQSKSRQIGIDEIRELIALIARTAYSGGWKAGVILDADRMTEPAANALLKTLEEPPGNSLILLLTSEPQSLLPTIASRCQKVALQADAEEHPDAWYDPLVELLETLPPASQTEASLLALRVAEMLDQLKKQYEDDETERLPEGLSAKEEAALLGARSTARLIEARTSMLRTLLHWQRDVLLIVLGDSADRLRFPGSRRALEQQALFYTRADALRRLASVEEMSRQLERNLPALPVLNQFFSSMRLE